MVLYRDGEGLLWRPAPVVLRHAIEGVLAVLLAVQAARLIWAAFAPIGPVGQPVQPPQAPAVRADLAVLARFDPFHRAGSAPAQAAPAASATGLRLYGVRAGRSASAIIAGPDGRQAAYALGEAVAPGVTLESVAGDHVVLATGGVRSRLEFQRVSSGSAPYMPPPSPPQPVPVAAPPPAPAAGMPELNPAQLAAVAEAMAQYQRGAEARPAQGTPRP